MSFRLEQVEKMVAWCAVAEEFSTHRDLARREFFGEDHSQPSRYLEGTGDPTSRQRRFLGWFMFGHSLSDGSLAGKIAVEELFTGTARAEGIRAIEGARFVLGIVTSVIPGRSLFLELEDERIELRSRQLSRGFGKDIPLVTWIVPSRPRLWIPGPGWTQWPVGIGPNIRSKLKTFQPDPISVERLLQGRSAPSELENKAELPRDTTLEEAVQRITEEAESNGRTGLVMSVKDWERMVLKYMKASDINGYAQEIANLVGKVSDFDVLNTWLGLAMNVWNTTPQPDRSNLTAYELSEVSKTD